MSRTDPQFKLRLGDDLLSRLREQATHNRRSLSAEINDRLAASLDTPAAAPAERRRERINVAAKALQGLMSNRVAMADATERAQFADIAPSEILAEVAVRSADALIAKVDRKGAAR